LGPRSDDPEQLDSDPGGRMRDAFRNKDLTEQRESRSITLGYIFGMRRAGETRSFACVTTSMSRSVPVYPASRIKAMVVTTSRPTLLSRLQG
jgi:hypothetical protein